MPDVANGGTCDERHPNGATELIQLSSWLCVDFFTSGSNVSLRRRPRGNNEPTQGDRIRTAEPRPGARFQEFTVKSSRPDTQLIPSLLSPYLLWCAPPSPLPAPTSWIRAGRCIQADQLREVRSCVTCSCTCGLPVREALAASSRQMFVRCSSLALAPSS